MWVVPEPRLAKAKGHKPVRFGIYITREVAEAIVHFELLGKDRRDVSNFYTFEIRPGTIGKCRSCGCTDRHACPDGCYWVQPDLCSECEDQ